MSDDILRPYYNIPEELRALRQWCNWTYEDIGASKPTKIPYMPNKQMANVSEPTTWSTFDEVITARFNFSGIGFIFSEQDDYTFLDLDDPLGDPTVTERQLKIFREFDSYAEVSPSGIGLHIIIGGGDIGERDRVIIRVGDPAAEIIIVDRNSIFRIV